MKSPLDPDPRRTSPLPRLLSVSMLLFRLYTVGSPNGG